MLQAAGDAHFNPIMVHPLRTEYGVELDDDEFDLEESPDSFADVVALLGQVASSVNQVPGFEIKPRLVWWVTSGTTTSPWWPTWSRTWRPSPPTTW